MADAQTWRAIFWRAWRAFQLWRAPMLATCIDCGFPCEAGRTPQMICLDCVALRAGLAAPPVVTSQQALTQAMVTSMKLMSPRHLYQPLTAAYDELARGAAEREQRRQIAQSRQAMREVTAQAEALASAAHRASRTAPRDVGRGRESWEDVNELYPH